LKDLSSTVLAELSKKETSTSFSRSECSSGSQLTPQIRFVMVGNFFTQGVLFVFLRLGQGVEIFRPNFFCVQKTAIHN